MCRVCGRTERADYDPQVLGRKEYSGKDFLEDFAKMITDSILAGGEGKIQISYPNGETLFIERKKDQRTVNVNP